MKTKETHERIAEIVAEMASITEFAELTLPRLRHHRTAQERGVIWLRISTNRTQSIFAI